MCYPFNIGWLMSWTGFELVTMWRSQNYRYWHGTKSYDKTIFFTYEKISEKDEFLSLKCGFMHGLSQDAKHHKSGIRLIKEEITCMDFLIINRSSTSHTLIW